MYHTSDVSQFTSVYQEAGDRLHPPFIMTDKDAETNLTGGIQV